jgi:sugar-specific transcriptional regulator TrmB
MDTIQKNPIDKPNLQFADVLNKTGLNSTEALIYRLLLSSGPVGIKPLLTDTGLKRGNAYYHLDSLIAKGLVEKIDLPKKPVQFVAKHPENLELLLAKEKNRLLEAESLLTNQLPELKSLYQLIALKPGVKFYEGLEGALKVADDSLTATTEILSYIDNEAVNKLYPEFNKQYVTKRENQKIKKRMLSLDSTFIRQHAKNFNKNTTQIRVIAPGHPFTSVMYIYNNKVSYVSQSQGKLVSMIIEHPAISQMHKTLFEALWQTAKPII